MHLLGNTETLQNGGSASFGGVSVVPLDYPMPNPNKASPFGVNESDETSPRPAGVVDNSSMANTSRVSAWTKS